MTIPTITPERRAELRALLSTIHNYSDDPLEWEDLEITSEGDVRQIFVPEGSYLGSTMIALSYAYEGSGEHCLLIQEALQCLPGLLDALDTLEHQRDSATDVVENIQGKVAMYAGKYETLVAKVTPMRAAQKDYFRTRQQEALALSKKLEREVDDIIKENAPGAPMQEQGRLVS